MESHSGMILTGKTEELKEPIPVPLYPPQIPHGLLRARNLASASRVYEVIKIFLIIYS
jgi:hypothetical protein